MKPCKRFNPADVRLAGALFPLVLGAVAALPAAVFAADVPVPSGAISSELLRQPQRLERAEPQGGDTGPALDVPMVGDQKLPDNPNVSFTLESVTFSETAILSREELDAVVKPYVGRKAGFAELQQIIGSLNALYNDKGYVTARAILPPQRIENGRVEIRLVEGRVGELVFEGNTYMSPRFLRERIDVQSGELVDPRRLEAELSRFNRISSGALSASLQPGKGYGLTDVYVKVAEPPRNSLDLFANNHGYESTGEESGGLMYRHYGALGTDDVFSLFASGSQGSGVGSLSYDAPVNPYGTRLGARVGKSRARVIYGPFRDLDSVSDSKNASIFASQPLWSNRDWLLTGTLTYGENRTENRVSGVFLNESRVRSTQGEVTALYLAPGRSARINAGYQRARSEIQGTPQQEIFDLWAGYWQLYQSLSERWFLNSAGGWQYSPKEGVPSSQLFQIGGATTVRGYRQGEIAGDGGIYGNLQANYNVNPAVTVFGFYDYGKIDSSFRQPEKIDSVGTGFNWRMGSRVSTEASLGVPLTNVRSDQDDVYLNVQLVFKVL